MLSCAAPFGNGGLGRHLAELVVALRGVDSLAAYLSPQPDRQEPAGIGISVALPRLARVALEAVRFSPGLRVRVGSIGFDVAGARRLPVGVEHLLVFNGQALRHIATARRAGYKSVGLVSANAHLAHEARQHQKAWRQYPIERPWASHNVKHNLAEYAAADYIYVSSDYAWESFVAEGVSEERLRLFPLTPHDRFRPPSKGSSSSTFNVVYIGSLSVHKGVPLLIDAVRRLPYDDLRLVLVGGWGTRRMRRHIEAACAVDPRIKVQPGDPLPHLMGASVCVHPSYVDGFAYAPAEALACGIPVIVTEDTGMKELVRCDADGMVIPTGRLDPLTQAIDAAYRQTTRSQSMDVSASSLAAAQES